MGNSMSSWPDPRWSLWCAEQVRISSWHAGHCITSPLTSGCLGACEVLGRGRGKEMGQVGFDVSKEIMGRCCDGVAGFWRISHVESLLWVPGGVVNIPAVLKR